MQRSPRFFQNTTGFYINALELTTCSGIPFLLAACDGLGPAASGPRSGFVTERAFPSFLQTMDVKESFSPHVASSSPLPLSMNDGEFIGNSEYLSPSLAVRAKPIRMPTSLSSPITSAMPATTIHTKSSSRSSPIGSVSAAPASATFIPQGISSRLSDDPTNNRYHGTPHISTYDIHSPEANVLSEYSTFLGFDPTQAPIPETDEEIRSEISRTRMMIELMEKEMVRVRARTSVVNVRTAIIEQELVAVKEKLARVQKKRKNRRSVRTSTRPVTPRMLREQRAAEQEEMVRGTHEAADAEA
ncbi:hypothetical protein BC827DRAFT_167176 [Russula dissimulans]|nr:hypothetical protein BC827DRAFT_167176 [Russula dissimulans]